MLGTRAAGDLARDESGFSLMEVLVAMVSGIIVMGALFAILQISLRQTSSITDKVQADQLGRTAMTRLIDELHSACIAPGFTPIQAESSETELRFVDAFSEEAVIPRAVEHRVVWNEVQQTLRDFERPSSGEWPKFTFPGPATPSAGTLVATNVTKTSGSTPIFQYSKYATKSSGTSESESELAAGTLTPIPVKPGEGLTESTAKEAASVLVTFTTAPTDNYTARSRSVPFSNRVTLALGSPSSESTIKDGPCQ
jgi:Tfp pilus assembly protein PilW